MTSTCKPTIRAHASAFLREHQHLLMLRMSGHALVQVPLIAALYHNDCHFLAQQLLLLPHCYISTQQELEVSLNMQDAAAQLRQAGSICLSNLVRIQSKIRSSISLIIKPCFGPG